MPSATASEARTVPSTLTWNVASQSARRDVGGDEQVEVALAEALEDRLAPTLAQWMSDPEPAEAVMGVVASACRDANSSSFFRGPSAMDTGTQESP